MSQSSVTEHDSVRGCVRACVEEPALPCEMCSLQLTVERTQNTER